MGGLEESELENLRNSGTPAETIALLDEINQEHPDAASIVVSLLANGWTITAHGEQVICVTLRSADGQHEILGHGPTKLDAFEQIQLKTRNFSSLLSFAEAPGQ